MRLRIYFGKGWYDVISPGRKRNSLKLKWNLIIFPSFLNSAAHVSGTNRGTEAKPGRAHNAARRTVIDAPCCQFTGIADAGFRQPFVHAGRRWESSAPLHFLVLPRRLLFAL